VGETGAEVVEVPLAEAAGFALDLAALEEAFAAGAHAMVLCNPHNPTGRAHSLESLEALAALAARYGVFVVSDEVHATLVHPGTAFTPFAPVAAAAGARAVTVTSASKAWNLAALKCAVVVAADAGAAALLEGLPEELAARTSLLGLHAAVVAFTSPGARAWRDAALAQIIANIDLLESELAAHAPTAKLAVRPDCGYLAWLDLRDAGLGDDPAAVLREQGRVAFNSGPSFGAPGRGFVRVNLACDPSTVVEAVRRIAATLAAI
jgi:cystathionine beta-lyase